MKFEDTGLPKHPEVEKAFAAMNAFFGNDKAEHFIESIATAKFLSDNLQDKMPGAIGAALVGPAVMMYGAKFDEELKGTETLRVMNDIRALRETPEDTPPAYTKETAAVSMASIAYAAKTVIERDLEINQYTDGSSYPAYKRAHEQYRKNELQYEINIFKADAPLLIATLKGEEQGFIQAFNGTLEKAEKQLASPLPEPKKPVPPAERPKLSS